MNIENTQECFVQLWLRLEHTRRLLKGQCKLFCVRRVLQSWFGPEATDDFIWEVCHRASLKLDDEGPVCGYDILPLPQLSPRLYRELLRAVVAVKLGISSCKVKLRALDRAYCIAFPHGKRLDVNKKLKD